MNDKDKTIVEALSPPPSDIDEPRIGPLATIIVGPSTHRWAYDGTHRILPPFAFPLPFGLYADGEDWVYYVERYSKSKDEEYDIPDWMRQFYIEVKEGAIPVRADTWGAAFMRVSLPKDARRGFWQFMVVVSRGNARGVCWFVFIYPGMEWDAWLPMAYDGTRLISRFLWVDKPGSVTGRLNARLYREGELLHEDNWEGEAQTGYIRSWAERYDCGRLEVAFPHTLPEGEYRYEVNADFGKWGVFSGIWRFILLEDGIHTEELILTPDPLRIPPPTLPYPPIPEYPINYWLSASRSAYYEPNYEFQISYKTINLGVGGPLFARLFNVDTGKMVTAAEWESLPGRSWTITHRLTEIVHPDETPPPVLRYKYEIGHLEGGEEVVDLVRHVQVPLKDFTKNVSFSLEIFKNTAPEHAHSWQVLWSTVEGDFTSDIVPVDTRIHFDDVPFTGILTVDVLNEAGYRVLEGEQWTDLLFEDGRYCVNLQNFTVVRCDHMPPDEEPPPDEEVKPVPWAWIIGGVAVAGVVALLAQKRRGKPK